MKVRILANLMNMVLSHFSPELIKEFALVIIKWLEQFVLGTKSSVDDMIVLPLIEMMKQAFEVPETDIKQILSGLIKEVMMTLPDDLITEFAAMFLTWIEQKVLGTKSSIDDMVVLPLTNMMRQAFNIPACN